MDRQQQGRLAGWRQLGLQAAGAVLLAVSAGIHLDLYLTGYRSIPTIGWLFLLQVIAAIAALSVVALALLGFAAGTAGAPPAATAGGVTLKAAKTGGVPS